MRIRESHRVPALLLACLVTALVFPRACAETRLGFGSLLPATAPLTAAETTDADASLREDRARLEHEVAVLREELDARPSETSGPLAGLRVEPRAARPERSTVPARVRHRDVSSTRRSFTIDAGRADGVREGRAVIHGSSLVGVVMCATAHSARVLRIDDPSPQSALAATVLCASAAAGPRRAGGVARGTGDGTIVVSFLRPGDAKVGDSVVTGAGKGFVPEGLVLGEVVAFGDDDRDGAFEAEVRPLLDLDTIASVLVMRDDADSSDELRGRDDK